MSRKRSMERSRSYKLDVCIGIIALLGVMYFAYQLRESLNSVAPVRSEQARQVGKMEVLRTGVRVKTLEDYSWYPMGDGAAVYTGDTVFTGNDSKAVLSLGEGGGEIRLEPYSLVTITEREGLAEITLHFGEFESDLTSGGIVVNADGERSLVQADQASVRLKKDTQELNIQVLRGDVTVDKHGESYRLDESQDLSLADAAAAGVSEFTIASPPPASPLVHAQSKAYSVPRDPAVAYSNGLYRVPKKHALNLNWEPPVEEHGDYEVVFAKDQEFTEVLGVRKFKEPELDLMVVPQAGFYWKVRAQSEEGSSWSEYSEPSRVNVNVPAIASKPKPPEIQVIDEDKAVAVQEFSPFAGVEQFEVQVKSDTDEEWKSTLITSPRIRMTGARGASTAWRVRPMGAEGKPLGVFTESFKVEFEDKIFPPKESPEVQARKQLRAQALSRPPLLRGPARQETFISFGGTPTYVVFDWKGHEAITQYEIQIAADEDFHSLVKEATVNEPLFVFKEKLGPGEYYWRVRSFIEGETSSWSPYKSLRIDQP